MNFIGLYVNNTLLQCNIQLLLCQTTSLLFYFVVILFCKTTFVLLIDCLYILLSLSGSVLLLFYYCYTKRFLLCLNTKVIHNFLYEILQLLCLVGLAATLYSSICYGFICNSHLLLFISSFIHSFLFVHHLYVLCQILLPLND